MDGWAPSLAASLLQNYISRKEGSECKKYSLKQLSSTFVLGMKPDPVLDQKFQFQKIDNVSTSRTKKIDVHVTFIPLSLPSPPFLEFELAQNGRLFSLSPIVNFWYHFFSYSLASYWILALTPSFKSSSLNSLNARASSWFISSFTGTLIQPPTRPFSFWIGERSANLSAISCY